MPTIRPAAADDLPTVYAFLCDLEETVLDCEAFATIYRTNLGNPAISYRLAEADNVPVGFLSCHVQHLLHHAGPVAEIQELYVVPIWRSRGVGRELIGDMMELAHRSGWVRLEVTSNRRRTRTHTFYERLGFAQTSLKFIWKPSR